MSYFSESFEKHKKEIQKRRDEFEKFSIVEKYTKSMKIIQEYAPFIVRPAAYTTCEECGVLAHYGGLCTDCRDYWAEAILEDFQNYS